MLTDKPDVPLILVVEDDESHAELIRRSLDDGFDSYRLKICSTLRDALAEIEVQLPNLVITDYRLPDGAGSELMLRLNGSCPVVLMTSQGSEQVAVEAMKSGVQDYVVKTPEAFIRFPDTVKYALQTWALIQSRKLADEAIRRGKREWEQTFDAVPDLISIIDTNHTLIRVNRAMAQRCGLTPEDLIGRSCHDLVHCSTMPPAFCPLSKMFQDGQTHSEEAEIKELGGFFEISVSPLYDADGKLSASVHVVHDITQRKREEDKRNELERQFLHAQKLESIGVLAGGIAHDFNNILSIILGHCFILKEEIDAGMTDLNHIKQIENAANRAADLCHHMLAYAGRNKLVQSNVNLNLLIDEMVKMLVSAIKKNVTINLDLNRNTSEINGDNSQVQQIVMNLIINAAEAIGDANGTITVSLNNCVVRPEAAETDYFGVSIAVGRYACLEVSDTGCGMDEDIQKLIFEPFYTTKFAGRGLGMSAILGIVKSHGGTLKLSSTPGVGTSFKIYFPLPETIDSADIVKLDQMFHSAVKGGTVLLVDDEESLRIIGAALLTSMGFSVKVAANGREALDVFSSLEHDITLVLLDMIMPVMGGIEAYLELRRISPDMPIVICSGYGDEGLREFIDLDVRAEFIQKPYNPAVLREIFNKIMC